MKIYSTLITFAKSGLDGYVLTNTSGYLPEVLITDEGKDSLTLVKDLFANITGVSKDWPMYFRQVGTFEPLLHEGEKTLRVVYSTYLPDLQKINSIFFEWKKIYEIPETHPHYSIIRYGALSRV